MQCRLAHLRVSVHTNAVLMCHALRVRTKAWRLAGVRPQGRLRGRMKVVCAASPVDELLRVRNRLGHVRSRQLITGGDERHARGATFQVRPCPAALSGVNANRAPQRLCTPPLKMVYVSRA